MALVFPSSPAPNDTYTVGQRTWTWNGSIWELSADTIGAATVTASELASNAVTTAKIADENVTTAKLANSNVTAAKIASDAVTEAKIASNAVTEAKIANSSITTAKIAAGAVEESDIASSAVTEAKIASNAVTTGKLGTDVQLGYRNVIINGAMQVAQRGTSTASITSTGYFTTDRYALGIITLGTWTQSTENDAPTGSGLRKSTKVLCTTADASPGFGDLIYFQQSIEGQNVQNFAKGTSSAKQFTLSFWVKSNVTGTYVAELYDIDNTRSVSATYSVSASATWEKKTITFPADTTGAFDNDNGGSLSLNLWLGAGSGYSGGTLATTWASVTAANRAAGQTNLAAATNNYWQITGIQLEAGSVATPFEFEDYGVTLRKCQRYYYRVGGESAYQSFGLGSAKSTTVVAFPVPNPVTMRTAPTSVEFSTLICFDGNGFTGAASAVTLDGATSNNPRVNVTVTGATQFRPYELLTNNSTSGYIGINAEL